MVEANASDSGSDDPDYVLLERQSNDEVAAIKSQFAKISSTEDRGLFLRQKVGDCEEASLAIQNEIK